MRNEQLFNFSDMSENTYLKVVKMVQMSTLLKDTSLPEIRKLELDSMLKKTGLKHYELYELLKQICDINKKTTKSKYLCKKIEVVIQKIHDAGYTDIDSFLEERSKNEQHEKPNKEFSAIHSKEFTKKLEEEERIRLKKEIKEEILVEMREERQKKYAKPIMDDEPVVVESTPALVPSSEVEACEYEELSMPTSSSIEENVEKYISPIESNPKNTNSLLKDNNMQITMEDLDALDKPNEFVSIQKVEKANLSDIVVNEESTESRDTFFDVPKETIVENEDGSINNVEVLKTSKKEYKELNKKQSLGKALAIIFGSLIVLALLAFAGLQVYKKLNPIHVLTPNPLSLEMPNEEVKKLPNPTIKIPKNKKVQKITQKGLNTPVVTTQKETKEDENNQMIDKVITPKKNISPKVITPLPENKVKIEKKHNKPILSPIINEQGEISYEKFKKMKQNKANALYLYIDNIETFDELEKAIKSNKIRTVNNELFVGERIYDIGSKIGKNFIFKKIYKDGKVKFHNTKENYSKRFKL